MGLREEQLEQRRQQILAAARDLISRDGAGSWSMRKVAQAAKVSVPTLYNLFGSKEQIRAAISGDFFEGLDRELKTEVSGDEVLHRILDSVERGIEYVLANAEFTRPALLAQRQHQDPKPRSTPLAIERYQSLFQAAIDSGYLRDDLKGGPLAEQAYEGFRRSAVQWAAGELDPEGFRAKALYTVSICLLAVATDESRAEILQATQRIERKLHRTRSGKRN